MYLRLMGGLLVFGVSVFLWWRWIQEDDSATATRLLVAAVVFTLAGIYFFSSKKIGAFLKEVELKLDIESYREQDTSADSSGKENRSEGSGKSGAGAPDRAHILDTATTAQIQAMTQPETSQSLQRLQHLLYTRAITDAEYQRAKDKLFLSHTEQSQRDAAAQLQQLAELHEAGILTDVEFTAAKLKVLGLSS